MLRKILQTLASDNNTLPSADSLEQVYQQEIAAQRLYYDAAQYAAIQQLQQLSEQLLLTVHYEQQSPLAKLRCVRPKKCRSLYLFGEVGGGKSLIMALFYQHCSITKKRRVHFNNFMLEVHCFIHQWRQQQHNSDALTALAKQIRASVLLLCFDEFQVSDIADAMILGRLFSLLFDAGITIVITSNRHPDKLYQGGLEKEKFLFFIKLLSKTTHIIELNASQDYRLRHSHNEQYYYYFPLNNKAEQFIQQHYQQLTANAPLQQRILSILGRQLTLTAVHNKIMLTSFAELCAQPLAAADYLQLVQYFDTVLLADIPQLSTEQRNEAKRFMTLIDIFYEHKIKLICTAEVAAHALYVAGDHSFEFKRTVSRLMEMQSDYYHQ